MGVKRHRTLAALALSTILIVGQLASFAHFAATPHIECSEDGELIHVETFAATAPAHSTIERDDGIPDRPHRHDHCQVVSFRRTPPLRNLKDFSVVSRPCSTYALSRTSTADTPPSSIAILRQAPKSSPPSLHA